MKRVILSALLVCITLASVCQLSKTEIANVINMSKEANLSNGVINPDKIAIGQNLTFLFADGTEKMITAENGDSQWKILDKKIADLIAIHGPVVPFPKNPDPEVKPSEEKTPVTIASEKTDFTWLLVLVLLAILFGIVISILNLKKKRKLEEAEKDPVTSGPAMRPGGVTDENALAYATEVANRQFPNYPNLNVREVRRGMLSGENLEVFYAGNATPQRRTFTNQPAYRGIVNLNGTDQFVYFLQGCGNDVRMGNYFTGQNIQFIADATATTLRPQVETPATAEKKESKLDPMSEMVKAMTAVLKEKNSGNMVITGTDGVKVEMFFSSSAVLFSANGHKEVIQAVKAEAEAS